MTTFDEIRKRGPFARLTIRASMKNRSAVVLLHNDGDETCCGFDLELDPHVVELRNVPKDVLEFCNNENLLVRDSVAVVLVDLDEALSSSDAEFLKQCGIKID